LPDIFLSYGHNDVVTARRFAEGFGRAGFSVWWDATLHSGDSFDAAIEVALRGAKAVVVLWSPASVQSRWVRAEATLADRLNTLVPVMIESCERPIMFELTQTASLMHWSGNDGDTVWHSLVADVRRLVEKVAASSANATATAAIPPATPERGGEPGVALLPIASRSGLPEDEVFAEDLVSEIVAELSRLTGTSPCI
jgi:TIR domain